MRKVSAAVFVAGVSFCSLFVAAGCAVDMNGISDPSVNGEGLFDSGVSDTARGSGGSGVAAGGNGAAGTGAGGTGTGGSAAGGSGAGGGNGNAGSGGLATGGPDADEGDVPGGGPKLGTGALCTGSGMCASGACVDGVCCESTCTSACSACSADKTGAIDGQCRPVSTGSDPDNECEAEPGNPCGRTGRCGDNGCEMVEAHTSCGEASCTGHTFTPAPHCDGSGTCQPSPPQSCPGNLKCAAGAVCEGGCQADADCVGGLVCDKASGMCKTGLALGAACDAAMAGKDCGSGHCIDGVCCESACGATCMACSMAKTGAKNGQCAAVRSGIDPDGDCNVEAPETCGKTGMCDGAGACKLHPDGTACGSTCCDSRQGQGNNPRPCTYMCKSGKCDKDNPVPTQDTCGGFTCCCATGGNNGQAACVLPLSCAGACH